SRTSRARSATRPPSQPASRRIRASLDTGYFPPLWSAKCWWGVGAPSTANSSAELEEGEGEVTDFNDLEIAGRGATPADADWDEGRHGGTLAADLNPSALALVESADDIAATVRFAVANDLKVAGQGTGHGAAPLPVLDDTILIRTSGMRGI